MTDINTKKKLYLAYKYPRTALHEVVDSIGPTRPAPFPRLVNCFITERCNFNCPMCHVKASRLKNLTELSFANLKPFFDDIAKFSPAVSLSGGEPLMHPEIIRIISYLTEKKLVKGLVTNGLLLEKMADDLIASGLDFLAISLDGPDEPTQYQRGLVTNSFSQIIRGIKKIVKARGNRLLPNIRIATVISKANIGNFNEIHHLVNDLGVDQWSISHHYYFYDLIKQRQADFSQKTGFGSDVWGEYNGSNKTFFDSEERSIIKKKLLDIQSLANNQSKLKIILPNSMDIENFYTGTPPNSHSTCTSPFNQVFLRGSGDIEMCHGYILGNIKQKSPLEIWTGDRTKKFQDYIKKNKLIPACFRCCSLNPKF